MERAPNCPCFARGHVLEVVSATWEHRSVVGLRPLNDCGHVDACLRSTYKKRGQSKALMTEMFCSSRSLSPARTGRIISATAVSTARTCRRKIELAVPSPFAEVEALTSSVRSVFVIKLLVTAKRARRMWRHSPSHDQKHGAPRVQSFCRS